MRIGTILHGAYGDVYEQALSIGLMKQQSMSDDQYIGFFSRADRLRAFNHFQLDMFDELHNIDAIESVEVDLFFQFQVNDPELNEDVLNKLPGHLYKKFDTRINHLPWRTLGKHHYTDSPLSIPLSVEGTKHYERLLKKHNLPLKYENSNISIGYLWRYRSSQGAVKPYFQKSKRWILASKSALFKQLIEDHGAHIVVAGMNVANSTSQAMDKDKENAGVLMGEVAAKFASETLSLPEANVTYLSGDGYASEMEIIARTDLQIVMPSGFSEPLWMRNGKKTLLVDPPPVYLLKLLKYRMPLFDNKNASIFFYNNLKRHSASTVYKELKRRQLL